MYRKCFRGCNVKYGHKIGYPCPRDFKTTVSSVKRGLGASNVIAIADGIKFERLLNGVNFSTVDLKLWRPKVTPFDLKKLHEIDTSSPLIVNGDRFGGSYVGNLSGLNIVDGVPSAIEGRTVEESGIEFFGSDASIPARIPMPYPKKSARELLEEGVVDRLAGFPWLISDGEVNPLLFTSEDPRLCDKHPRTITGLNEDVLSILVVDGRQSEAEGMSAIECAELVLELGINDAVMHDGGSSSAIVSYGEYLTNPSEWTNYDLGVKEFRPVGNALVMTCR